MYSDDDLDSAVAAGVLDAETARRFRAFASQSRAASGADEEQFRLLTGFNDIFVAIAAALLLGALGWLVGETSFSLGGAAVAAASWALAEYFTRRRRMALPSLLLLLTFVGGVFATAFFLFGADGTTISAALVAIAAFLHWRRFKVPITVAAGVAAAIAAALALLFFNVPQAINLLEPVLLVSGLAVFALALGWDMSDRSRTTRRSDVAFWLHLSAAPLIVHPIFQMLGLTRGSFFAPQDSSPSQAGFAAGLVLAIYLALALVALAIDRRALLVSGLSYVLYATSGLLRAVGSLSESLALTALAIGAALLLLSAYWRPARKIIVGWLPATVRMRLPVA